MSEGKPPVQKFQETISEVFGQPLTNQAEEASQDFWNHWNEILHSIDDDSMHINVDMLFLSKNFPEYGRYNVWKGLSIIVLLVGLILFIFSWKIAVATLIVGIGLRFYGNAVKSRGGQRFIEELKSKIIQHETKGMAKLCAHYIAGNIQLTSNRGQAHWPAYPSCVFGGEMKFIK